MNYQNKPYLDGSESSFRGCNVADLGTGLNQYDVIVMDIFDTLLLRSFAKGDSLLAALEQRLRYSGLVRLRKEFEVEVREEHKYLNDNAEISIDEIWDKLSHYTGIPSGEGIQEELGCIADFFVLNPYMKHIYRMLRARGKKIVLASDSIIPEKYMGGILSDFGISSYEKLYLSCDYGCSKKDGLWELIKQDYDGQRVASVGDNRETDVNIPNSLGIAGRHYPNVHEIGNKYRADGMSDLIGSAYAGLVNIKLHNGMKTYSPYYEYGYVYGGMYIFGFCQWMHKKARHEGVEKILFLSRDGAIYQRAFRSMFDDIDNEYFLWSRIANIKYALSLYNREDCMTRILTHRAHNPLKVTMESVLKSMQIKCLIPYLRDYGLRLDSILLPENLRQVETMFVDHWQEIVDAFETERKVLKEYVLRKIGQARKIAFVDVGWAGSGAKGLKYFVNEYLGLDVEVRCWQAAHNPSIQGGSCIDVLDGTVETYIFSDNVNKECFDQHTKTNRGLNNMFFELFTQDLTPSYAGVNGDGRFFFDIADVENHGLVKEIHQGMLDFCKEYSERYKRATYLYNISGYDAYIPYAFVMQNLDYVKEHFSHLSFSRSLSGDTKNQKIETLDMILRQINEV